MCFSYRNVTDPPLMLVLTLSLLGESTQVHVCEERDRKTARSSRDKRACSLRVCACVPTPSFQDIRDLVLHLSADAPPPSWVRVEVCTNISTVCSARMLKFTAEPALSTESRRPSGAWSNARCHLSATATYIGNSQPEPSPSHTPTTGYPGARDIARYPFLGANLQPRLPNASTGGPDAYAFRPQLVLPRSYHRRGKEETLD